MLQRYKYEAEIGSSRLRPCLRARICPEAIGRREVADAHVHGESEEARKISLWSRSIIGKVTNAIRTRWCWLSGG